MKRRFIAILSCIPMILSGCNGKQKDSEVVAVSSEEEMTHAFDVKMADIPADLPFTIVYPKAIEEPYKDKIFVDDIFLTNKHGLDLIVVNYKFKQCWEKEPTSFDDLNLSEFYLDGIGAHKYYGTFYSAEAEPSTKLMLGTYANILEGFRINNLESVKDKKFTLYLWHMDGFKKGFMVYQIEGNIADLKYKEVD